MRFSLLLAALGLPALALAQSASFAPHAYLGAGVSVYNSNVPNTNSAPNYFAFSRYTTSVGPVLTVGYQFAPRLAVQLSPAMQWGGYSNAGLGYRDVGGQLVYASTVNTRTRFNQLTVPLLLRVTLTNPASRLHVDGLLGAAWLHLGSSYSYTETGLTTGTVLRQQQDTDADNSALLTLAPAVRYDLGPRLALALTVPVHYELRDRGYGRYYYPVFSDHLRYQVQLGAHYALASR